MKVIIFGGFLGSGKTSIMIEFARFLTKNSTDKTNVVIIENEIGEIGIDDKLLSRDGYSVTNMFSGCVCCTLAGALVENLGKIQKNINPEYVLIETTGVAYPLDLKNNIEDFVDVECRICCVVDAKRWNRIKTPLANLLQGQLGDANVVLINKIDLVDDDTIKTVVSDIQAINKTDDIFRVTTQNTFDEMIFRSILGEE